VRLEVDIKELEYIDDACLELLMSFGKQYEASGGELLIDWARLHQCFQKNVQGLTLPAEPPEERRHVA